MFEFLPLDGNTFFIANKAQKACAFTAGFVECLLLGGVVYGWANLVYVLKSEEIFRDKCHNATREYAFSTGNSTNDESSCEAQDNLFDLAFTIASFSKGAAALFVGLLLDFAGLRVTRLVSTCSLSVGGFLIGFCSKQRPYYLFPGSLLIGLGGTEVRIANFQIANMFPKNKATVMSLYNGAFCGSGAVFLILKWSYEYGLERSTFMYIWTGVSALMLIPTFILLPKGNIKAIDEAEDVQKARSLAKETDGSTEQLVPSSERDDSSPEEHRKDSVLSSFRSISYVLHLFGGGTLALGLTLYIGTFNWWASSLAKDKDQVSRLSEIYGICQIPMIAVAPFVGMLMDTAVKRALKEENPALKRKKLLKAGFLTLVLESVVVTLLSTCRLFPSILSVHISLAIYTFARPILNSVNPGYLRIRFPQAHFNKLMGVLGIVMCIYFTMQFPLFIWIQKDPFLANLVIVGILISTLVNPLHLLCLNST